MLLIVCALLMGLAAYIFFKGPPNEADWAWTLRRVRMVFDTEALMATAFEPHDVERYYRHTTNRDYALLAAATRCSAMHTELRCTLPLRLSHFKQLVYPLIYLPQPAASVLEVGSGKGSNTVTLAALLPHASFVGLDAVAHHAAIATEAAADAGTTNACFVVGNAAAPPAEITSKRYDLVFGVESLCHLDTDAMMDGFLHFAAGTLTSGGRLVIVDGFRSSRYNEATPLVQSAMRLAECGFRIRRMATKAAWVSSARRHGLQLIHDEDLTAQALPFWTDGWKAAVLILFVPRLARWYIHSSEARTETGGSFLAVCCTAAALALGSAEYGVLAFEKTEGGGYAIALP